MELRVAVPVLLASLLYTACGSDSGSTEVPNDIDSVAVCGNGRVETGEACDDGNDDDTDGCTTACALPVCGDGFVQGDEECDEGEGNANTGACLEDCTLARCGDGFVHEGVEACDDANDSNNDSCLNTCEKNECGDGFVYQGVEACDDGNDVDDDACSNECVQATCGDAIVQEGELCDDGNDVETDECTSACLPARCGDGWVQGDEQCDEGEANADTGTCTTQCKLPVCGDGFVQEGEACDEGANNSDTGTCTSNCEMPRCGDGFVQPGEACDEGDDNSDTGTCTTQCRLPGCGDGFVQGDEECDDGPLNGPTAACLTTCVANVCGDGFVHAGVEACDDGAMNSDTGACRPGCIENICGDGFVEAGVEDCDEGAANSNTGTCTLACRAPSCGDGFIQGEEECDDGAMNSNAPDATCRPSCLLPGCGDGIVDAGEACDDGNLVDNDSCSNTCGLNGDTCANPAVVTLEPVTNSITIQGDITGLGKDYDAGCRTTSNNGDLFYQLTAPFDGIYRFELSGPEDLVLAVGSTCGVSTSELACSDRSGDGGTETAEVTLTANQTVFVVVDGYGSSSTNESAFTLVAQGKPFIPVDSPCDPTGETNVCVTGSQCDGVTLTCRASVCGDGQVESGEQCDDANNIDDDACANDCTLNGDTCAAPAVVSADPLTHGFTVTGDTSGASADYNLACRTSSGNGDLVYQFTTPVAGEWTFSLATGFDAVFAVQTTCGDTASDLSCKDATGSNGTETIVLELAANQTIFLVVDGYSSTANSHEGPFTLTATVVPELPVGAPCDPAGNTGTCVYGSQCDPTTLTCVASVCGNGIAESGELCDDGNTVDDDACANDCTPNGDTCGAVAVLTADPATNTFAINGDTTGVGADYQAGCSVSGNNGDLVYQFTAPVAGRWSFSLSSSAFDFVLAVQTTCGNPTTNLGCEGGYNSDPTETVSVDLAVGDTVFLLVDGYGDYTDNEGPFTLEGSVVPFANVGDPCDPTGQGSICAPGSQCDGTTLTCRASVCGNGQVESGEQCDDGNAIDDDLCSNACTLNGDTCATAPALPVDPATLSFSVDGDTRGLSRDYGATCRNTVNNGDMFFEFTSPVHAIWTFSVTGPEDLVLAATTTCGSSSTELACKDGPGDGGTETFELELAANQTIFLVVDGYDTTTPNESTFTLTGSGLEVLPVDAPCDPTGSANVCVYGSQCDGTTLTCRASICGDGLVESGEQCDDANTDDDDACNNACQYNGDTCAAPMVLASTAGTPDFTVSGDTSVLGADYQLGCAVSGNNGDIVYQLTAPVHGIWKFEVSGTFDTGIAVQSTCGDTSTNLACAETGSAGAVDMVELELQAGQTVFILVDGYGDSTANEGTFTLNGTVKPIQPVGAPCDPTGATSLCAFGGVCDTTTLTCVPTVCGNGVVEPNGGEECDDQNTDDWDACTNDCKIRGDSCAAPFDLRLADSDASPTGVSVSGDLAGFAHDRNPSCHGSQTITSNYRDVVYQLTGNGTTSERWTLELASGSSTSLVLDVASACAERNARIACVPNATSSSPKSLSFDLGANETVYVWIDTQSTTATTYTLTGTVQPLVPVGGACDPTEDRCDSDATCVSGVCTASICGNGVVEGVETCDDGNTLDNDGCSADCYREGDTCDAPFDLLAIGATADPNVWEHTGTTWAGMTANYVPSCSYAAGYSDVVYVFTAPQAGSYTFAETSTRDVVLYAAATCPNPGPGADLYCADSPESFTRQLAAGETIFIFVDPYGSTQGTPSGTGWGLRATYAP